MATPPPTTPAPALAPSPALALAPTPTPSPSPGSWPLAPPPPSSSEATPPVAVKPELPASSTKETPSAAASSSGEPSPAIYAAIAVPSHARWFSFGEIHETERRILPEFFDGRSAAKNPSVYRYYRDSIIRRFRENPARKVTFTEVRRSLVGDVGSVRRVFDFLETWGLINYAAASERQGAKGGAEDKEKRAADVGSEKREGAAKSFCTTCKSECNIVCFATEKVPDLVLCARCFVRGSFRGGLTHADFKRVDVSGGAGEKRRDWTDKDILHLLEALLQYGDDWKKVAAYVGGGKSEKDCVTRFIRLPFAEQFMEPLGNKAATPWYQGDDHGDTKAGGEDAAWSSSLKRMRLSPLADASNPIMSQVAFLSAMAGSEVAEAAARAAVVALDEVNIANLHQEIVRDAGLITDEADKEEAAPSNDHVIAKGYEGAAAKARVQLEKEQQDIGESLSHIVEVQMKEIQEKIVHFEELELLMEKEWLQLQYMKNLLFADQLNLLQQRSGLTSPDTGHKEAINAANDAA